MKVYEICFSPTGGVQAVSRILGRGWGQETIKVDLTKPSAELPRLQKDDFCIVSVPSYSGRVPALAAKRISLLNGNGAAAVLTVVYGNRAYEDTLLELKDLLTKASFRCVAAVSAIAEHSIVRQIAKGRPDAQDKTELLSFAEKIRRAFADGKLNDDVAVPGSRPYRQVKPSSLHPIAGDKCTSCGICAAQCPAEAISRENPKHPDPTRCIACMRCIAVCPQQARALDAQMLEALTQRLSAMCTERRTNECFL